MEEMSYKDRIEKFLEDERYYSLLIKGKWGVGKTYLWKEIQDKSFQQPKKNIIYISLFGKESYKEVLEEIVIKACTTIEFLSKLLGDLKVVGDISIGTILTLIKSKYFKQTVDFTNIIVCFDDIERKSHNFRMKDFLGLVYQLKEDKCKVVIISNIDELPNYEEKVFKKYKEKSIDLTIEIESKREVIYQILKEKLKDEYYEKLFPDNVYKIKNLRNLNKIIEAFKFFSQEFNFEYRLKEKEEFKNLFTYVFELIVSKINDIDSKDNENERESIVKQSEYTINRMIDDYIKNTTFHVSSFIKESFEEKMENYHFYTLMRDLKGKFGNIVIKKNYSNEIKEKIENIIIKIDEKEYITKFVYEIRNYYHLFCIFDFLSMIEILNLKNSTTTKIKEEIIKQVPYKNNETLIDAVCNNDEELKKYAKELTIPLNMNINYNSPQQQKNKISEEILSDMCNYWRFEYFIKHNENYTNEEIKEAIKDNKIILQYICYFHNMHYKNNEAKFKGNYPILYEIWSSNKN